jgi:hypothetical protein
MNFNRAKRGRMVKFIKLGAALSLVLASSLAGAQKAVSRRLGAIRPHALDSTAQPDATAGTITVTPATISFAANNPGSSVAGNNSATIKWPITGGTSKTWTLSVYADTSTFSGCATVPASAVSVKCTSATVNSGTSNSASCSATSFTALSTTSPGLQVASGSEGTASSSYTVVLNYEIADSWEYIANTCPLTITYTVNAP